MNSLRQLVVDVKVRVRQLFGRRALRERVNEEMQFHLEMRAAQWVKAGVSAKEARRRAKRELGNLAALRDTAADMWRFGTLERLAQDVRYGLRTLGRAPGFTAVAASVLAIGIGLNTTIFSVVNAYLLLPISAPHPGELIRVSSDRYSGTSRRSFQEYRDRNSTLSELVAFNLIAVGLRLDGETDQAFGEIVSGNYFSTFGAGVAAGRPLGPDDDRLSSPPVIVVSHQFWQRRLGSRPDAVGLTARLNDRAFTIVGIASAKFAGMMSPLTPSFWVPLAADAYLRPALDEAARLDSRSLHMVGRLEPGVDRQRAGADLDTIGRQIRAAAGQPNEGRAVSVYAGTMLDPELLPPVMVFSTFLMVMSGLLLLIVCVNLGNLLLARSTTRGIEMAIRQSIGAGRGRLVRQLLTESLIVALAGAAGGVAVASASMRVLMSASLPGAIPVALHLPIDWHVLAFSIGAAVLATLVFGLAPALGSSRLDLVAVLKGAAGSDRRHSRVRTRFLVAQIAMSVLLLVAAGLSIMSARLTQAVNRGFDGSHVLTASVDLEARGYTPARGREFIQDVTSRLDAAPGIEAANVVDIVPLTLSNRIGFFLRDGDPKAVPSQPPPTPPVYRNSVGTGHFATLQIPILAGRDFAATDTDGAPLVGIVNETFARRFWPGRPAVGQRLRPASAPDDQRAAISVIGVVKDSMYVTVGEDPKPFLYQPLRQAYTPQVSLLVRSAGAPGAALPAVRQVVRDMDAGLAVSNIATMDEATSVSMLPALVAQWFLSGSGLLALILSALGTYGVVSYLVRARARELAIRLAIGASPRAVAILVVRHALKWTVTGCAAGLTLAFLLTRFLAVLLYGVSPTQPGIFGGVGLLMIAVGGAAALVPALRAARQDPLVTLRRS